MKVLITPYQLSLLTTNCHIKQVERFIQDGNNVIIESKLPEYLVRIFINGNVAEIRIGASSSATALAIAKQLFPRGTIAGVINSLK
jgi:hypothetical protein